VRGLGKHGLSTLVAGLATATFRTLFIVPAARDRPMEWLEGRAAHRPAKNTLMEY